VGGGCPAGSVTVFPHCLEGCLCVLVPPSSRAGVLVLAGTGKVRGSSQNGDVCSDGKFQVLDSVDFCVEVPMIVYDG